MNQGTLLLGIVAALAIGGTALVLTRDDEEDTKPLEPPEENPPRWQPRPPIGSVPTLPPPQWPPLPPSDFPIIGGQYVDSINKWCPPGYIYNGVTGMCEAIIVNPNTINPNVLTPLAFTQGNGTADDACCDSCANGGACTGCAS